MRAPLAFGAKLVLSIAAFVAFFFAGHSIDGRPEFEIHAAQNLVLAGLGTWAMLAVTNHERLPRGLWSVGAVLALLAPIAVAVTQATQAGTFHGVGWAFAALCFAVFGNGAGAMARDWPQLPPAEDPLRRIGLAAVTMAATVVAVRWTVSVLPDGKAVAWQAGAVAVAGVAMSFAAPALPARARGKLTLHGIAIAASVLVLFAVSSKRGNPLMVWGPLFFLPAYAEARWRPERGAMA